jgi:hypothetical protein
MKRVWFLHRELGELRGLLDVKTRQVEILTFHARRSLASRFSFLTPFPLTEPSFPLCYNRSDARRDDWTIWIETEGDDGGARAALGKGIDGARASSHFDSAAVVISAG